MDGILIIGLCLCLYAYTLQLRFGLGVAGIRDYVSWGLYLANFVFFVATSLIGMLISGVLGLIGIKWITPIARIAEIIAVAFAAIAGVVIIMDMGRPDHLAICFYLRQVSITHSLGCYSGYYLFRTQCPVIIPHDDNGYCLGP